MKLKFVKAYQGIDVGRAMRMHVKLEDTGVHSIEATPFGVVIDSTYDSDNKKINEKVLVPYANVAYARVLEEKIDKEKSKKA